MSGGWVVVVWTGSWPEQVIGPMQKPIAEALARGLAMAGGGSSPNATAVQLEQP